MIHSPNPVDVHVGIRIRHRRKTLGVTQEGLADALGITFQQVQKYERSANRVSASKLFEIADKLDCEISYFFDGLSTREDLKAETEEQAKVRIFMNSAVGQAMVRRLMVLPEDLVEATLRFLEKVRT